MDVLDDKGIDALAGPTRRKILKALGKRKKTQAEIAKELGIKPPTVSSHLKKLEDARLVKKEPQNGRKWIYYSLTSRGEGVTRPQTNYAFTLSIGLGVFLVLLIGYLGFNAWASAGSEFDGLAKSYTGSGAQANEIPDVMVTERGDVLLIGRLQLFQAPYAIGGESDPSGMILTEAENSTYYQQLAAMSEGGRVYVKGAPASYAGVKVRLTVSGYELLSAGGVETPERTFVVVTANSTEPLEEVPPITGGGVKEMDVGTQCG